jgi:multicomponent Na+:H+ antiporter subunit G
MIADAADALAAVLILAGALFCLISAIGILRMPDVLMRMQASTKAGTLGCGLILIAVALIYRDASIVTRALAAIAFLLITAPVAAHMIGRSSYFAGVRLWRGTVRDELRGRYGRASRADGGRLDRHSSGAPHEIER